MKDVTTSGKSEVVEEKRRGRKQTEIDRKKCEVYEGPVIGWKGTEV